MKDKLFVCSTRRSDRGNGKGSVHVVSKFFGDVESFNPL